MMEFFQNKWKLFFVTVIAAGLPLWLINYHTYTNEKIYSYVSLLIVFALGIVFRMGTQFKNARLLKILVGGFLLALVIKIIIDVIADATDHNLFPFELVIGFVASAAAALLGISIGWVTRKIFSTTH